MDASNLSTPNVDDMIVAGDDEYEKQILKEKLATQFE